jgi:pilus assembly protein Flp/PilA
MRAVKSIQSGLTQAMATAGHVIERLLREDSGQDLIEYALVFTFVALAAIASMKSLETKLATVFATVGTTLTSAT